MKLVKRLIAICCAAIMAVSAAACGANVDSRTEITVWSWEPSMKQVIASFEKENPDIHVIWKNTSGYDNLNNAIQDGYGIPDVVQLEYYALRQYAVSGQLVAITGRTEGYGDFYTPGTWASVQLNGRVYGLPMDSGPMAFFYNDSVFEQVGIDASKIRTWDDYYEAAKKLKSIGVYIAADSGDASFYDTMIWLAGGRPFSTSNDGKNVTINLTDDEGTRTFTEFWQKMIDEGLVATNLTTWSDGWKEAVGEGKIASMFSGAWLPSLLHEHPQRLLAAVAAHVEPSRNRGFVACGTDAHAGWQLYHVGKRRFGAGCVAAFAQARSVISFHRIRMP